MEGKLCLSDLFLPGAHLSKALSEASQCLAWVWSGNKLALVAWETQEILSPNLAGGTSGPFLVNEVVVSSLLSQSPLVWQAVGAEGRGLTVMSWIQWSAEVPWTHRREGWIPASWKALLMSLHFCCSGSEMVHHRTSIPLSTGGRGE